MSRERVRSDGNTGARRVLTLAAALFLMSMPLAAEESDGEEIDKAQDILEVTSGGRDLVFMSIPIANPIAPKGGPPRSAMRRS